MKNIRNFVIIAHIDHGKSTLADRFLELTNTIEDRKMQNQILDSMELEREKGITIKMQPVRMNYKAKDGQNYILNLIDTPGHVDFGYEVSRSLATVEGAILLVDATKGIQAQTITNLELAKKENLVIIPVINKIDLKNTMTEEITEDLSELLQIDKREILLISAKNKLGIQSVLEKVIEKTPPPKSKNEEEETTSEELKALIFDSFYDKYKGVIAFVRIFNGSLKNGDKIYLMQNNVFGEVKELGYIKPNLVPSSELKNGEIGYIATNIKDPEKVDVGETIVLAKAKNLDIKALKGYKKANPLIFLSIFPQDADYKLLEMSLEKLKLSDSALAFKSEYKEGLGRGFQVSFLGLLHAEIITERLRREFNLKLILSAPSIIYRAISKDKSEIISVTNWPNMQSNLAAKELWIMVDILTYKDYLGATIKLLNSVESEQFDIQYLGGDNKIKLTYNIPLREIVIKNFYDKLKSVTQGYASMSYDLDNSEWRDVTLTKLDVLILGVKEDVFSKIVPVQEGEKEARLLAKKLKENIQPQQFKVPLQVMIGGRVVARETLSARRKDVTAGLYGGDITRKKKVLERQKKGKKEMQMKGKIKIPAQTVLKILK